MGSCVRATICTASAVLFAPTVAWSQMQMPYYDVNGYCASESAAMGAGDMGVSLCVDREQYDYNNLQYTWTAIDPTIQQTCIQQNPIASYSRLRACITNMKSDQMLQGPGFRH